jgi:hypothetical protein
MTPYLQASYLCNRSNDRNAYHLPRAQTLKEPDQGYFVRNEFGQCALTSEQRRLYDTNVFPRLPINLFGD